jgi:hypothetical protein
VKGLKNTARRKSLDKEKTQLKPKTYLGQATG